MDLKDAKTQKIIIAALAFFIVSYFWYSRVYSVNSNQISIKTQEFETITTNLRSVTLKAKSLDVLKAEYKESLRQYRSIEALLPEFKQIPSILVQLHTASSLSGTKITKVIPLSGGAEEFYNVASFEIEMVGTFHDFGKFISYVANFPFIANVSGMKVEAQQVATEATQMKNDEQVRADKIKETITANFVLSTYFVKEDERLRELRL